MAILLLRISVGPTIDYFLCCPMLFQHINNCIAHDVNPSFSDGHSVLEIVLATGLIVTKDIPCHMKLCVKRTVVRWESNKKIKFKDAICNSTEDYERVSTSLDSSLSNIADATKESVDTIVKSLNDLLLNCAKKMDTAKYIQQNHANTKIGMTQNVVIKEMHLIWQEGDIETIKVRKSLN